LTGLRSISRGAAAALLLAAGCALLAPAKPPSPLDVLRAADAGLPQLAFADLSAYRGAQLYGYMNGAAEAYYQRNFRSLGTAETKWRSTEAVIELYRLASPDDARGLFADHDDGKGVSLGAGAAGTTWTAKELEAIFRRGPYFCRVIVYGNDAEARELLKTLATAVDRGIGDD
jgi:hypothetical protein